MLGFSIRVEVEPIIFLDIFMVLIYQSIIESETETYFYGYLQGTNEYSSFFKENFYIFIVIVSD